MGLSPVTREAAPAGRRFPYVLFAAPPSGSEDYPGAVAAAALQWDGSGALLFTSSMSVCATEDGSAVSEDCPLVPQGKSPSTDRLLAAEAAALSCGGSVLRLVGLYHAARGPHTFFLRQGTVERYAGYTVNMLHYEDAARLAVAALRSDGAAAAAAAGEQPAAAGRRGHIYVGCDGVPLTFREMVDACLESGQFTGEVTFTGATPSGPSGLGKRVANDATRAALGWEPKYPSFREFFMAGGRDYYNTSGLW
jgi:nucleoside-diphosphate-sugar epimerase